MAATLITVAVIASRMIKRENECSRLNAIRLAMNKGVFNLFLLVYDALFHFPFSTFHTPPSVIFV
jgi:hypothetical protein